MQDCSLEYEISFAGSTGASMRLICMTTVAQNGFGAWLLLNRRLWCCVRCRSRRSRRSKILRHVARSSARCHRRIGDEDRRQRQPYQQPVLRQARRAGGRKVYLRLLHVDLLKVFVE
jgi:hypothetical protein